MVKPTEYASLDQDQPGERGSTEEFLLRCLLGAREESGIASNATGFDEDVNVYVVGLLGRFLSAEYHDQARRYCYPTDLDLAREVAAQGDDRFCYLAYRTNADQLLLGIGLFCHVEGHGVSTHPVFGRSPEELSGRGSTYYNLASSSLRRLRRECSGPELAMTKLAARFDAYTSVLNRLRTSYFNLTCRISEGELFHLGRAAETEGGQSVCWDRFLDAWSEWKAGGSSAQLEALRNAVAALQEIDPSFSFDMPDTAG